MKEIETYDIVCATPLKVGKHDLVFGESTIVKAEKNLIVFKKNKEK